MKKIFLIFFCIFLSLTGCQEKMTDCTPTDEMYSVWEEQKMFENEEYVCWKEEYLLKMDSSYTVWEENQLSRQKAIQVIKDVNN